jgi:hypothetical protein
MTLAYYTGCWEQTNPIYVAIGLKIVFALREVKEEL